MDPKHPKYNKYKAHFARKTNLRTLDDAMKDADVFAGVSVKDCVTQAMVKSMAKNPIIFAMANPDPEIMPEEVGRSARIIATGRSDYSNQINNVLCFPGLFRGVLDCQAREINDQMLFAAANAIAEIVTDEALSEDYIIPGVLNKKVPERVANYVKEAAIQTGVAKLEPQYLSSYRTI